MNSIYWLILIALCILIEIATLGLTTIWFAGGGLVAFFISFVTDNLILELAVFLVISLVLLLFTRPVAMKYFNKQRTSTNYESLIGKEVKVIEEIDNFNESGLITLNGTKWVARALDDSNIYQQGDRVIIRDVTGVKLIVERKKEDL